jgi:hypothetical protein
MSTPSRLKKHLLRFSRQVLQPVLPQKLLFLSRPSRLKKHLLLFSRQVLQPALPQKLLFTSPPRHQKELLPLLRARQKVPQSHRQVVPPSLRRRGPRLELQNSRQAPFQQIRRFGNLLRFLSYPAPRLRSKLLQVRAEVLLSSPLRPHLHKLAVHHRPPSPVTSQA